MMNEKLKSRITRTSFSDDNLVETINIKNNVSLTFLRELANDLSFPFYSVLIHFRRKNE